MGSDPGMRSPFKGCVSALALWLTGFCFALATDVFYTDGSAASPNGRYKIEAVSQENQGPDGPKAFADGFVYTLTDMRSGDVVWTRKQAENEGSCASLHINDEGWVVIGTGWNELLVISPEGKTTGCIDILRDAMTEKERSDYVADTTAGPMWAGRSAWYFSKPEGQHLFVIRPWWGRRIVVDISSGRLIRETPDTRRALTVQESQKVVEVLESAVVERKKWDNGECCDRVFPISLAAYLAGCLHVEAAIPYLESLQDSSFSGSSTSGGLGYGVDFSGEVNPHSYSTYTLRQIIRFSMRKLGRVPKFLPCHEFTVEATAQIAEHPYRPAAKSAPGRPEAERAREGMSAAEVLDLLGSPEWITYDTWEYDIDAEPPFTLRLKWNETSVVEVATSKTAAWLQPLMRERMIAE